MDNDKEVIEEKDSKEKNAKQKFNLKKIKEFIDKIPYKPAIILVLLLIISLIIPKRLPSIFRNSNFGKIEKICQLATVEAYYHNVADRNEEAGTLGKIFGNIGYKRYWLEYDAIVQYGIDAKKVRIEKPNMKNEVKVYIPEAEVLGEPRLIKEFIQDPVTDTGFLTTISGQDKTLAIEDSIKTLKETALKNQEHLNLARERTKNFFEKYIINAGKEIGVNYKVIFEE